MVLGKDKKLKRKRKADHSQSNMTASLPPANASAAITHMLICLVSRRLLRLQSGDYLLLNAATAHEFRSPNAHADDIGTGGLWGLGSIILAIEGVTELPILINETIKCVIFSLI